MLEYRGIPVEVLAKESCFEEVVWLLIKGDLPTQKQLADFDHDLRAAPGDPLPAQGPHQVHAGRRAPDGRAAGVRRGARHVLPVPARSPTRRRTGTRRCRLIAAMPTLVAAFARTRRGEEILDPRSDLDHAGNFYYMLFGKEPTPAVRKVLDACLILHAEHTMNACTFTARVTGSTLANPYQTIASAIGSLSGPLHGGANEEVLRQFEEIGGPENVKAWLDAKLAANPKFKVMGIGHRVYKVKDARATVLQELAEHVFAEIEPAEELRDGARTRTHLRRHLRPEGDLPERRFLLRRRLPGARHPDRPVHADLRHRPRRRLAGPLARATRRQPHLPPGADLRRQDRREVRAAANKTSRELAPMSSPCPMRSPRPDRLRPPLHAASASTRCRSPTGSRCRRAACRTSRGRSGTSRSPSTGSASCGSGRARADDERSIPTRSSKLFGRDSRPEPDRRRHPPTEIRATFDRVHARVMDRAAGLPRRGPRPAAARCRTRSSRRGSRACGTAPLHEMIHCGQIALIRRMLGQKPIW